jgi:hypothetical protein
MPCFSAFKASQNHRRGNLSRCASLFFSFVCLLVFPFSGPAQNAGGVTPSGPQVRLLRSVVGAKGEQRNGNFVMTEPRSVFYVPDDREVIVYFEWEGTRGMHHCEGSVKGPNGQFATMSSFNYNATQPRFAGFWKVPLSESTPSGNWIFESRVDGESAGQVNFQVGPGTKPADAPKEQPLPTTSDIYKSGVSSAVTIEKLDPHGRTLSRGSGFATATGIVTSFRTIEGATTLRLKFPDGKESQLAQVLAWNKRQDWAILPAESGTLPLLKITDSKNWNVGDHCYWIDVKADGSRIISDGQIVGVVSRESWGDRINISGGYNFPALGGPLFDERGNIIGILGGALPETYLRSMEGLIQLDGSQDIYYSSNGTTVAATLLPNSPGTAPHSLQELWTSGAMTPVVTLGKVVLLGMLTPRSKDPKAKSTGLRTQQVNFRAGESAEVIVAFQDPDGFKTTTQIKVYDFDNHLLRTGNPEKLVANKKQSIEKSWALPLGELVPGIYRIDVFFGDEVAWRQYFKIIS